MSVDSILIENGYVLTMDPKRRIIRDGSVLIEGQKISRVGKTDELAKEEAELVIDAKNMVVMPGMIDTHVHLSQALIRGCADDVSLVDWLKSYVWVLQGNFTKEDGRVSAELCMAEMIRTGTTSFIDCMIHTRYGFDGIAQAVEKAGMRGALSKIIMDSTGYADSPDIMYPGMVEDKDACLSETAQMHSKWHGKADGRLQVWYGLRSLGAVTPELFQEVARLTREKETGMTMHLGEVIDDVRYVRDNFNMTLTEFAKENNLSKSQAANIVGGVFDSIREGVRKGEKVSIAQFGTFEKVHKKARTGRNPATGETVTIPAKDVPKFKIGKGFKDFVN